MFGKTKSEDTMFLPSKARTNLFYILVLTALPLSGQDIDPSNVLWYKSEASVWEEALPVGNGRLGAMVFGKVDEERIQVNEDTYWSGGPYSTVVKGGADILPDIQEKLFEGKPLEAHKLFGRHLMGYPVEQQKYQSLANIILNFNHAENASSYRRLLDLRTGVVKTEYEINGVRFTREVFSSEPDQAIIIRISADRSKSVSFSAELRGNRNMAHSNYGTDYFRMDPYGNNAVTLTGRSADYLGIEGKLKYRAVLKIIPEGGEAVVRGTKLYAKDCDAVTLFLVAATNFVNYNDVSADENDRVEKYLENLNGRSYSTIKNDAIENHAELYNRVKLILPETELSKLSTKQRIDSVMTGSDPSLAALSYNFGRYVLISSSRPGTQPANLQGIWNEDQNPSWDSKYTTNINTEMNYWAVESGNLAECAEPLIKMVEELTDQGSEVAREHYGASGWVFHQNTDLWRVAAPMDGPTWGTFTTGGAWLTTQLWEHYLYNPDPDYLRRIYPIMKGSVEFFMDFLVEHPNGRWLVTNPSNSPENPPKGDGYEYFYDEVTGMYYFTTICYGSSIDMQIINDLFKYFIEASSLLSVDKDFAYRVEESRQRLVPPQIGKDGTLQEWTQDFGQLEDKHRHFSHLYGLYPGNVISANLTPEFVDACKAVLEQRGDGGTGFSRAWKMSLWSRLYDGERANDIFKGYINEQAYPQLFAKCFTPLQVDGTLGVTAGITEMLMHSHEGYIDLLPALPQEWDYGSFEGLGARGGFELSFGWENGRLSALKVLSTWGKTLRIKIENIDYISCDNEKIKYSKGGNSMIEFQTVAGKTYEFHFK